MPPFEKPSFTYNYRLSSQIAALREHRALRSVPKKASQRLLIATWNVANLGVQARREKDYRLIAEMIRWFDVVALQEVNDDLSGLVAIKAQLPASYQMLFSDYGGNKERTAFLFDSNKVERLEKVGEVAVPPADHRHIKIPGIDQKFRGFDRNPYLATFRAGSLVFLLNSVHLYFGSESKRSVNRRCLETLAVARWADLRRKSKNAFTRDIIVLGDFNLPRAVPGDPVYEALTKRGLHLPDHSSRVGSSIKSDSHYDQIAFFPGQTGNRFTGRSGVFDFDGAVFRSLWDRLGRRKFILYTQYYLSDHRLLWAQFDI